MEPPGVVDEGCAWVGRMGGAGGVGGLGGGTGEWRGADAAGSSGPGASLNPTQAPYTLQVNSRVVLTDVTVTDKHGNPVTGLTEGDFRILDNGKQQRLTSFEEHKERMSQLEVASAAPAGSFSNDYLKHPPAQVNVLLFDTTTIGIIDQMYLFQQMRRLVANLPAGEPVAVFSRSGDVAVELESFTDDHEALMAAIQRAIPHLQRPGSWMASDLDTLEQMALYLSQVPGRKNLIWFTSGSNLFLQPDPTSIPNYQAYRAVYDLLESERIAIYPIDARGLTTNFNMGMAAQQLQMRADAAATGGTAYVNTNGLALAAQHILATDGNYYTLSYAPDDLKSNSKWHRVEVKLAGGNDRLSYRHGYFDDGSIGSGPMGPNRTVLKAGGKKVEVPNDRSEPIVFHVEITPVPAGAAPAANDRPLKRGETRYVVKYDIPAKGVYAADVQGNAGTDEMGAAVLAFDQNGSPVARRMVKLTIGVDESKARMPSAALVFTETVNLRAGRNYLYLGLCDLTSGRLGTVNAEVNVPKSAGSR